MGAVRVLKVALKWFNSWEKPAWCHDFRLVTSAKDIMFSVCLLARYLKNLVLSGFLIDLELFKLAF